MHCSPDVLGLAPLREKQLCVIFFPSVPVVVVVLFPLSLPSYINTCFNLLSLRRSTAEIKANGNWKPLQPKIPKMK